MAKPKVLVESRAVTSEHDALGLERLVFFSDAVFAIAITLLALEIRLPPSQGLNSDANLQAALLGQFHQYLAFFISFLVIGTFWISHHRKFRLIKRYDARLLFMNLLLLMGIAFIPFPSSVISAYSNRTATIFYAGTMVLVGLLMALIWWYASYNNRLVDFHLSEHQRRRELMRPLLTVTVFVLSIGIAYYSPDWARISWLLIFPVSVYKTRA